MSRTTPGSAPAAELAATADGVQRVGLAQPGVALRQTDDRTELVVIPAMAHALADEPGTDPAPQTPHATLVDRRYAVEWFRHHLTS